MKAKKMNQSDWLKETYVKPAALSGAVRQKAFKERIKKDQEDKFRLLARLEILLDQADRVGIDTFKKQIEILIETYQ